MPHYLVDGYNLLYALPDLPRGTWQEKREALLALLQQQHPQGNNRLTIVFDSRQGWGDKIQEQGILILFTSGETADDKISAMVRLDPHPRSIVVVTNDQGLRRLIRGTGARSISTEEFLKPRGTPAKPARPNPLSDNLRDSITEELKKKWL